MSNKRHSRAAGELLRSLLNQPEYRERWLSFQHRDRTADDLNQAAIAMVIALDLWERGERSERRTGLPRELKDRVKRALAGDVLSNETLTWFIKAFAMSPEDARRLRAARFPVATPAEGPVVDSLRVRQQLPVPQRHRTVSVFERRVIGSAARAVEHHTTRALSAASEQVDSYPYRLMHPEKGLVVLRGGRVTAKREFTASPPVLDITLNTPLRPGQVASLVYRVDHTPTTAPCSEYRRVAHGRTDNVDLVVQFHPDLRPGRVWWAVWDDFRGGNVLEQHPVDLDRDGCAHRFLSHMQNAAVGFHWAW